MKTRWVIIAGVCCQPSETFCSASEATVRKGEYGRSLFDSRHRFAGSLTYAVPLAHNFKGVSHRFLDGWQFNALLAVNSSTPFTVYDSANVSLQAPHPGVSGMFGNCPNDGGNPNQGALHEVSQWIALRHFSGSIQLRTRGN